MGSGEASKGHQDILHLAGWAINHQGQLPSGTKNFPAGDKWQNTKVDALVDALPLFLSSMTQGCVLPLQDSSAGYQQGSRVPQCLQGPDSGVKVGLGPMGQG